MSTLWVAACAVGSFPLMLLYLHRYGTFLSPAALFTAVWLFAVGMFNLGFVSYIQIHDSTWAMLGGSGLCFLAGCLVAHLLYGSEGAVVARRSGCDEEERRILWTLAITVPLGLWGIASYVTIVGRMVGYDAWIARPFLVRVLQDDDAFQAAFKWTRFLNYLNIFNVALGSYYRISYPDRPARKLVTAVVVFGFATTLLSMDRTLPATALTWGFFTAELRRRTLGGQSPVAMFARFGALIVSFVAIFALIAQVLGKTLDNNLDAASHVVVSEEYQPLMMPYIYLTANIPAFQEFVRHTDAGVTGGVYAILPLMKIVQATIAPKVFVPLEVGEYYPVPFVFNTHTWLDLFWSDFGYAGLTLMPLLMGLAFTLLFLRSLRRPSLRVSMLAGLACYVVINSVFVNKLTATPTWEYAIIIGIMGLGLPDLPVAMGNPVGVPQTPPEEAPS